MISEARSRWFDREKFLLMEKAQLAKPVKNDDGTVRTTTAFTLRHAKKCGALPSVTYVIKNTLAESGGLKDYWNNCLIRAAIQKPFVGNPDDEAAYEEYKEALIELASQHKNQAADRGKEIHAAVATWIEQNLEPQDPVAAKVCACYSKFFEAKGVAKIETEKTIGRLDMGIVGTPDQVLILKDECRIILDLKTVEDIEKFRSPYDSWMFQEGGYSLITDSDPHTQLWQAVACRKTGHTEFIEHKNPVQYRDGFQHLYEVWTIINNYDPRRFAGQ